MAATSFFGGEFFGGEFFNTPAAGGAVETPRPPRPDDGGGHRRGRGIVKPLGLPPKRKGATAEIQRRVEETHDIAAEVAGQIARELGEEREARAVAELTMQEVEREIGLLLRKKLRTEEDEILLLLLMAAAAVT